MKRTFAGWIAVAGIAGSLTGMASGQDVTAPADRRAEQEHVLRQIQIRTGDGQENINWTSAAFVSGFVNGPTVMDAPYSAEAVTESVQTLADGNRIVNRSTAKLYRDGQGRERREDANGGHTIISITDPVAQVSYTISPETETVSKLPVLRRFVGRADGTVPEEALARELEARATTMAVAAERAERVEVVSKDDTGNLLFVNQDFGARVGGPGPTPQVVYFQRGEDGPEPVSESLGQRNVGGVQADGVRTTITIPAGQIGNERPIEVVDERWYSAELQMTVMTLHRDPRVGETSYKLQNIQLVEPVPTLFEVPANYRVDEHTGIDAAEQDLREMRIRLERRLEDGK